MTESKIGIGMNDIKVETNFAPAPVEQKSPETTQDVVSETPNHRSAELITTEPKTDLEAPAPEPEKPTPSNDNSNNDIARRAIEAEMRAETAERRAKELEPKSKAFTAEPDINNYATLEEWKADLKAYHRQEHESELNQAQTARKQAEQQAKIHADVRLKAQESKAKHPDFDDVLRPLAGVMDSSPVLSDFIARNPMGMEVAYELGKNPAILEQIIKNSDIWQVGEQLLSMAARLKNPVVVQVSKAPEPIKPVGSREVSRPNLAEMASKDMNGYMAMKKKQKLAKLRAN